MGFYTRSGIVSRTPRLFVSALIAAAAMNVTAYAAQITSFDFTTDTSGHFGSTAVTTISDAVAIADGVTVTVDNGWGAGIVTFTGAWTGSGTFIATDNSGTAQKQDFVLAGDMSGFSGTISITQGTFVSGTSDLGGDDSVLQFGNGAASSVTNNISGTGEISTAYVLRYNYAAGDSSLSIGNSSISARYLEFKGGASYVVSSNLTGYNPTASNNTLKVSSGSLTLSGAVSNFGNVIVASGATLSNAGTLNLSGAAVSLTSAISNSGTLSIDSGTIFALDSLSAQDSLYTLISNTGTVEGWDALSFKNFTIDGETLGGRSTLSQADDGTYTVLLNNAVYSDLVWDDESAETWTNDNNDDAWTSETAGGTVSFVDGDSVAFNTAATVALTGTVNPEKMTINAEVVFEEAAENAGGTIVLANPSCLNIASGKATLGSRITLDLGSSDGALDISGIEGTGTVKYTFTNSDGGNSGLKTSENFTGTVKYTGSLNWCAYGASITGTSSDQVYIGNDAMTLSMSAPSSNYGMWGSADQAFKNNFEFTSDYKIFLTGGSLTFGGGVSASGQTLTADGSNGTLTFAGTASVGSLAAGSSKVCVSGTLSVGSSFAVGTLSGDGRIELASTGFSVSNKDSWAGTVALSNISGLTAFSFDTYATTASKVEVSGLNGWLSGSSNSATPSTLGEVVLKNTSAGASAFKVTNGSSGANYTFSSKISGDGTFEHGWSGGSGVTFTFSGDVSGWTGTFLHNTSITNSLKFTDSATEVKVNIIKSAGTLNVTFENDRDVVYSGIISGANLTHSGAGTLTLSGTGTNTITTLTNTGTLTLSGTGTNIISADSSASGSSTIIADAGTLRFNSAGTHRTYTSSITLNNFATLGIWDADSVSAGEDGNYQFTFTGNITVNGTNKLASNWAKEIAVAGALSGAGTLTYTRANDSDFNVNGRMIITGDDKDFSGKIIVNADNNKSIGIDLNASLANATVVLTGGSTNPAFMSIWKDVSVKRLESSGTAEIGVGYGSTADMKGGNFTLTIGEGEFSGIIQDKSYQRGGNQSTTLVTEGVLGIIKNTEGTLTLSGANTYTGTTTVEAGTLKFGANGTIGGNGGITVNSDAVLDVNGYSENAGSAGTITLAGGSLLNNGSGVGDTKKQIYSLALSADSEIGGSGEFGLIGSGYAATTLDLGTFTLTKTGENKVLLVNTTISNGNLVLESGSIKDTRGTMTLSGVSLSVKSGTILSTSGLSVLADTKSFLSVEESGSATLGTLSVAGTFNLSGTASATTLSGAGTLNAAGTLKLSGSAAVGTLSGSGRIENSSNISVTTFDNWTGTLAYSALNGTDNIVTGVSGSTAEFSNSSGYLKEWAYDAGSNTTGAVEATVKLVKTFAADGTTEQSALVWDNGAGSGAYTALFNGALTGDGTLEKSESKGQHFTFAGDTSAFTGTFKYTNSNGYSNLTFGGFSDAIEASNTTALNESATIAWDNDADGSRNTDVIFNYSNDVVAAGTLESASLVKKGAGALTLSAENTYSGGTTIEAGTLVAANASALGTGTVTTNENTTLALGADAITAYNLSGAGTVNLAAETTASVLTVNASEDSEFSGVIEGAISLTKSGTGTFMLSGANTYTGETTISAGTLVAANAQALSTNAVNVETDGTLSLAVSAITLSGLSGAGTVNVYDSGATILTTGSESSSTMTVDSDEDSEFSGVIEGAISLTKSGAGTFTLSGENTYTGETTISAGTLVAANVNAVAASSKVSIASGASFGLGVATVNAADLSGAGTVCVSGIDAATLNLTGTGDTSFAGAVGAGVSIIKASGALTFTGDLNAFDGKISGSVVNFGNGTDEGYAGVGNSSALSTEYHLNAGEISADELHFAYADHNNLAYVNVAASITGATNVYLDYIDLGNEDLHAGEAIRFTAKNTYTGETVIAKDTTLYVAHENAIANSSTVTVDGHLYLDTETVSIKKLEGSGQILLNGGKLNACTLNIESGTFSGSISTGTLDSGYGISLVKTGEDMLDLSDASFGGTVDLTVEKGGITLPMYGLNSVLMKSGATLYINASDDAYYNFYAVGDLSFESGAETAAVVVDLSAVSLPDESVTLSILYSYGGDITFDGNALAEGDAIELPEGFVSVVGAERFASYVSTWAYKEGELSLTLAIPEPSLFGFFAGLGILTLVGTRRRRKRA